MEKLWQSRTPPNPLKLTTLPDSDPYCTEDTPSTTNPDNLLPDQRVWHPKECGEVFVKRLVIYHITPKLIDLHVIVSPWQCCGAEGKIRSRQGASVG